MKTNALPVINCGFGYLLSISVVAIIVLICLHLQYKYREGDDRPYYDDTMVEDIFIDVTA